MTWSDRLPGALLLCLFGSLLVALIIVFWRQFGSLSPTPTRPQQEKVPTEDSASSETSEPTQDVVTQGFHSGGLGLERAAWEVLHGIPALASKDEAFYRQKMYKVTYQQGVVWQLEKRWPSPGVSLAQARARIRRYLPLDSRHTRNVSSSEDLVIDVYQSPTLPKRLPSLSQQDGERKGQDSAPQVCVAVHHLTEQTVTDTLLHIGPPRSTGYPLSSPQSPPQLTTTTKQSSVRKEQKFVKPRMQHRTPH